MEIETGENIYTLKPCEEGELELLHAAAKKYIVKAATGSFAIPDAHAQSLLGFMSTKSNYTPSKPKHTDSQPTETPSFKIKAGSLDAFKHSLQSAMPDLSPMDMTIAQTMIGHMEYAQTKIELPDQLPEGWAF
jgi:hypothetical protein